MGDALLSINDESIEGITYKQLLDKIRTASRPLTLRFGKMDPAAAKPRGVVRPAGVPGTGAPRRGNGPPLRIYTRRDVSAPNHRPFVRKVVRPPAHAAQRARALLWRGLVLVAAVCSGGGAVCVWVGHWPSISVSCAFVSWVDFCLLHPLLTFAPLLLHSEANHPTFHRHGRSALVCV